MVNDVKNYYEVLEVQPNVNQEDILQAYKRAKNAYTGDSIALYSLLSQSEADKVLELIEEAFNILSCPDKRSQYNQARGIESTPNGNKTDPLEENIEKFKKNEKISESSVIS